VGERLAELQVAIGGLAHVDQGAVVEGEAGIEVVDANLLAEFLQGLNPPSMDIRDGPTRAGVDDEDPQRRLPCMASQCLIPGCQEPGIAWITREPAARSTVVLVIGDIIPAAAVPMCARHAAELYLEQTSRLATA
jgi:hypothetical protein